MGGTLGHLFVLARLAAGSWQLLGGILAHEST
jgi:hypothetical protein